ncbi:nucleoside:proton symporter [Rhodomicrobium udaipurense JA643]|uniref:Nucleoside:proton symporter n=1 Tax=Rhodomicrobium udaipurense TaxID=1202716 RepID=A0A8I1KJQ6_9HYPH|nr:nucleoside transporter C-terminal domain-containing protein [Rhodomicrobium udaipurense]KAI95090.1 nucleoside:proton symporter [Rhodomicrobium udaipurense JA643]MBJ7544077.1 nucleoside:proton symporter [Rhodomicrobium udaipurense]
MQVVHGLAGIAALLAVAWCLSEDRWRLPLRIVASGIALQLALAVLFIEFPPATAVFATLNDAVGALQTATDAGTALVFGYLGGAPLPFTEVTPGASFVLAFKAFPLVLVISALASLMLYLGILQRIVGGFAFILRNTLGIGGALGLGGAVHIFVGMVEAPLLVRAYLMRMSRGELFALMSCGMAGVAGTMMVIYASLLGPVIPGALGNILIASVISTPAALAIAAIMVPFEAGAREPAVLEQSDPPSSALEAITRGTTDGIFLVASIIAMLIVFVALVHLVNAALGLIPYPGGGAFTLQQLFGFIFKPLLWAIGIGASELDAAAGLMATKTVVNEFAAYLDLARLPPDALSPRSKMIMTYALCGFANFGSAGIMIGGMSVMAPERRSEIVELAPRSIVSGTLATMSSGAVAGMLV